MMRNRERNEDQSIRSRPVGLSADAAEGSHDPADIILDPGRGPSETDRRQMLLDDWLAAGFSRTADEE